jgi:hypothetical protein
MEFPKLSNLISFPGWRQTAFRQEPHDPPAGSYVGRARSTSSIHLQGKEEE